MTKVAKVAKVARAAKVAKVPKVTEAMAKVVAKVVPKPKAWARVRASCHLQERMESLRLSCRPACGARGVQEVAAGEPCC